MTQIATPGQLRMTLVRRMLFVVPAVVLLGFLSGALSGSGADDGWYRALAKPAYQPPGWVFPVAWTALYALNGVALALVLAARGSPLRTRAAVLWAAQFALNLAWSPVFFGAHRIRTALLIVTAMLVLATATAVVFARVRRTAGLLLVPYLAWLAFATLLNTEILLRNPGADGVAARPGATQVPLRRL